MNLFKSYLLHLQYLFLDICTNRKTTFTRSRPNAGISLSFAITFTMMIGLVLKTVDEAHTQRVSRIFVDSSERDVANAYGQVDCCECMGRRLVRKKMTRPQFSLQTKFHCVKHFLGKMEPRSTLSAL